MEQTINWATHYLRDNGCVILAESIQRLRDEILNTRWRDITLDNVSVGSSVTLFINYYHIIFDITIKNIEGPKHDERIDNSNSISLTALWSFGRPKMPLSCLKSLLESVTAKYSCDIHDNSLLIISPKEKAVDTFIDLCDIAYKLRIEANEDLKKYVTDKQLNPCIDDARIDYDDEFILDITPIATSDILIGLSDLDCARDLDTTIIKNNNSDDEKWLNKQGIIAFKRENDGECALFYFRKAIEKGSIDAMINGFYVLWHYKCYIRAYNWLHKMNTNENKKNIKCLWNEAMLWFYGNNLENNPLEQNIIYAKKLLNYIVYNADKFIHDNIENKEIVTLACEYLQRCEFQMLSD